MKDTCEHSRHRGIQSRPNSWDLWSQELFDHCRQTARSRDSHNRKVSSLQPSFWTDISTLFQFLTLRKLCFPSFPILIHSKQFRPYSVSPSM
jgi:hypothetical protein